LKSLHLKVSEDTHEKFCKLAGDRKLGSVQAEIFTNAVNELHRKMFSPVVINETMLSGKNE
jgi:hypothetical protein